MFGSKRFKIEANDYKYRDEYPETSVFKFTFSLLILSLFVVTVVLVQASFVIRLINILSNKNIGINLINTETFNEIFTFGTLANIFAIFITDIVFTFVVYIMYLLFYPVLKRSLQRMKTIRFSNWSPQYMRKAFSHIMIGEIGIFVWFTLVMYVPYIVINKFTVTYVAAVLSIFTFSIFTSILSVILQTSIGKSAVDRFFEIFGGYEDGSRGRKLHKKI